MYTIFCRAVNTTDERFKKIVHFKRHLSIQIVWRIEMCKFFRDGDFDDTAEAIPTQLLTIALLIHTVIEGNRLCVTIFLVEYAPNRIMSITTSKSSVRARIKVIAWMICCFAAYP